MATAKKNKLAILRNPWVCVVGIAVGLYIGQFWSETGLQMAIPGDIYLSLLKMSVMPIISTAIIAGLAKMLRGGLAGQYLSRMIVLFIITVFLSSALGMLAGFIGQPGSNLGQASEAFIGNAMMTDIDPADATSGSGIWSLLIKIIPANIFHALSTGQILSVIFISVLLGAAVGFNKSKAADRFLDVIQSVHDSFVKILSWVLYGLPIGLACMIGGQVASLGIDAILALGRFIGVFYIAATVLCILYLIVIKVSSGHSLLKILSTLREPLFVSFSAASCVAPIPMAQTNIVRELGQPREVVNLVVPLSVAMNRQSYALLFSLTAVFLAQLFGKSLDMGQCMIIFFGSALVGTAAAGRLAAVAVMLTYILDPIGIPSSVAATIYVTIGAIIDPMVQMTILFGGCANASVIVNCGKMPMYKPIGVKLVEKGYITEEGLANAVNMHKNKDKLGNFLVEKKFITEEQLSEVMEVYDK